jgi:putative SOS response-associated peptidase YedK
MCGRYRLGRGKAAFVKVFGVNRDDFEWSPRYNIAPTDQVPTIRQHRTEATRVLEKMRWGLVPYWAKDLSIGARMINARSEDAATKPAFKESLAKRRCLVPADGFYEWKKQGKARQPYCFALQDDSVFAFAGIWDRWKDPQGQPLETFSILTTEPNALTADIHNRMPVILRPDDYELWLDPGFTDLDGVVEMLKPYDAKAMKKFPVSPRVNNVANDDASLAEPVEPTNERPQEGSGLLPFSD